MRAGDIGAVADISAAVHGRYAEFAAVYAERLALWPAGCFVWQGAEQIAGLLVAHPWHSATSPALNAMLGAIPADADTLYLHDIALLPETRGQGAGGAAVSLVIGLAHRAGFETVSLVAVNGAERFWAAQGFAILDAPGGYGPDTYRMQRRLD